MRDAKKCNAKGRAPDQEARCSKVEARRTVFANLRSDKAVHSWAKDAGRLQRIDRKSDWGDPSVLCKDGDRASVIANYCGHLECKPDLQNRLGEFRSKVLACW